MEMLKNHLEIGLLKQRMQSLALLDAVLCPEWEFRYFSYNNEWNVGETMGSIRNGSGDNVFALFSGAGCFIKVYDHVRPVCDGAYAIVPLEFREAVREPAFSPENVTVCYWRSYQSGHWKMSGNEGGFTPEANFMLAALDGGLKLTKPLRKNITSKNCPLVWLLVFLNGTL